MCPVPGPMSRALCGVRGGMRKPSPARRVRVGCPWMAISTVPVTMYPTSSPGWMCQPDSTPTGISVRTCTISRPGMEDGLCWISVRLSVLASASRGTCWLLPGSVTEISLNRVTVAVFAFSGGSASPEGQRPCVEPVLTDVRETARRTRVMTQHERQSRTTCSRDPPHDSRAGYFRHFRSSQVSIPTVKTAPAVCTDLCTRDRVEARLRIISWVRRLTRTGSLGKSLFPAATGRRAVERPPQPGFHERRGVALSVVSVTSHLPTPRRWGTRVSREGLVHDQGRQFQEGCPAPCRGDRAALHRGADGSRGSRCANAPRARC